jgi:hypothetical protein
VGNVRYGFTAGGTTIKFWNRGELPGRTGAPGKRTRIRLMTAFVEDADATHALPLSRGVPIKVAPHDLAGLARSAATRAVITRTSSGASRNARAESGSAPLAGMIARDRLRELHLVAGFHSG